MSAIVQFVFGCRHHNLSGVFTIKKRTYRVCLECGREFEYSGPLMPYLGRGSSKAQMTEHVLVPHK